ncbi:hypothetical protein [Clostridium estertheticum]|uniref:hypothetical protein n=1 Tax=Clostridium estertheticum TaxID=238834 RepID=UPI001CF10BFB|nr:hypothetical protein [Clostridium estertheticum]MCB2340887.1 hypothetical protein [Clostridium estertheticum]
MNYKSEIEVMVNTGLSLEESNNLYNETIIFAKNLFFEFIKSKSLIFKCIDKQRKDKHQAIEKARIDNLVVMINEQQIHIENKIDLNFICSEEFVRIVLNIFEKAKIDYREEKLKYYANIILNYSTIEFSKDFYKEGIIESISKLSMEHILVLDTIYIKHLEINDEKIRDFEEQDNLCEGKIDMNTWEICINTLYSDGFIRNTLGNCTITNYGIKCIDLIKNYEDFKTKV